MSDLYMPQPGVPNSGGWVSDPTAGYVQPASVGRHQHSGGELVAEGWQSYTPALSNVTLGNGTLGGRFIKVGRTVTATLWFVMGSTSSITGFAFWGLPLAATTFPTGGYVGAAYAQQASSGSRFDGVVATNGTSVAAFVPQHIQASVPFVWTTSDSLTWTITYETVA